MSDVRVDIAIPATLHQHWGWWSKLCNYTTEWARQGIHTQVRVAASAKPDTALNINVTEILGGYGALTSTNRNQLVREFRQGDADWIFFIDQDTVPPADALPTLLRHNRRVVGGVYYHRDDPHHPLMFRRGEEHGRYMAISTFERGALVEVDATGMGCMLIHREVFETLFASYVRYLRTRDGSQVLVHKDDVRSERVPNWMHGERRAYTSKQGDFLLEPVRPLSDDEAEAWDYPWFQMTDGRTEDLGFCERVKRCGYQIYIDTRVECTHMHMLGITGDHFRTLRDQLLILGDALDENS